MHGASCSNSVQLEAVVDVRFDFAALLVAALVLLHSFYIQSSLAVRHQLVYYSHWSTSSAAFMSLEDLLLFY